jgi:hypothetical protein
MTVRRLQRATRGLRSLIQHDENNFIGQVRQTRNRDLYCYMGRRVKDSALSCWEVSGLHHDTVTSNPGQ